MAGPDLEAQLRSIMPASLDRRATEAAMDVAVPATLAACEKFVVSDRAVAEHLRLLYRFLAAQSAWDKRSAPDLTQLVTREAVDAFCTAAYLPSTTVDSQLVYRAKLRRVADVVNPRNSDQSHKERREPLRPAAAVWPALVEEGPFTALAAAYRAQGWVLHGLTWRRLNLVSDLAVLVMKPSSAPKVDLATLEQLQDQAASLREVSGVAPRPLVAPGGSGVDDWTPPTKKPGPKRLSRTAAVRAARAAQRTRKQAVEGGLPTAKVSSAAPVEELRPEYAEAIAAYRPYRTDDPTWAATQDVVRAMLAAYRLPSLRELKTKACHIASFAVWAWKRPEHGSLDLDLTLGEITAPGIVEEYLAASLASSPECTKATARCALRRALRGLSTTPEPEKYRRGSLKPPYSPADCAGFVRLARNQPTKARRRAMCALVGLGLGAGLDGREQKLVTPEVCCDIELANGEKALGIDMPGPRPRLVIVSAEYEGLVREALALHRQERRRPDQPLYVNTSGAANVTTRAAERAVTATGEPVEISGSRLRSTWLLAAMCSELPLGALLHASGLRSPLGFVDLLPYCPAPDPADVERIEHRLKDPGAGLAHDEESR